MLVWEEHSKYLKNKNKSTLVTEISTGKNQWNLFISQQVYKGKPALVANPSCMGVFNLKLWSIKVVTELFSPFEPQTAAVYLGKRHRFEWPTKSFYLF